MGNTPLNLTRWTFNAGSKFFSFFYENEQKVNKELRCTSSPPGAVVIFAVCIFTSVLYAVLTTHILTRSPATTTVSMIGHPPKSAVWEEFSPHVLNMKSSE